MIRMNRLAICLSIAGLALAACGSEPEPDAAAATAPQPAARPAAPADPIARMARAVGNGKPGAAVDIRYDFAREAGGRHADRAADRLHSARGR